jgi:tetrahedral aminopeptidase
MELSIGLLQEICLASGAPGYEERVRRLVIEQVTPLVDEVSVDNMGNVIALKKGRTDKKVMAAAHLDEISFIITHIDKEGYARFHTLGGFDPKTLTAQRVIVHGKSDVMGVMGSKPIHIMSAEDRNKAPKVSDYFIDFGMTADKVREQVSVGDVVTRERDLVVMGDCVCGKSLDNRVSVFILIEVLRKLRDPFCDFYAVFSVQEEVGMRGATVAARKINPDFGFGLDTTIANDVPGAQEHEKITSLGQGTAIKVMDSSVITDSRMVRFMRETAEKHKIRYQLEVLPAGGTDTAAIQRSGDGAITGCVSIPTRHIHSVVEMCHLQDIAGSIDLLRHCLQDLEGFRSQW